MPKRKIVGSRDLPSRSNVPPSVPSGLHGQGDVEDGQVPTALVGHEQEAVVGREHRFARALDALGSLLGSI